MPPRFQVRWALVTILMLSAAACVDVTGPTTVGPDAPELTHAGSNTALGIGTSPTGPTRPAPVPALGVGTSPRPQP
jgi:hypothetical protein